MKLVTVAGPPSCGKTSVILRVAEGLSTAGVKVGVVKFDCLSSDDQQRYEKSGIPVKTGLSGGLCPDHFFIANIEGAVQWGVGQGFDLLISESAGLCNRCSPHVSEALAVCVIDNLSGVHTPRKIGPMLKTADLVVITKGDIVSQAEREVFAFRVRQVNPRAAVLPVNGLTGQGTMLLQRHRMIDERLENAIRNHGVTQVIEVAAGLSPRGLRFTGSDAPLVKRYVEADLPGMVAHKQSIMTDIGVDPAAHRIVTCNALASEGPRSIPHIALHELDPNERTAIITEGLINYFPLADVSPMWRNFSSALANTAGGVYLSDAHLDAASHPQSGMVNVFKRGLDLATRSSTHFHHSTSDEAVAALQHSGFATARLHDPADFLDRLDLPGTRDASLLRVIEAWT